MEAQRKQGFQVVLAHAAPLCIAQRGKGQNYLKSLLALGFQAFLIMVVVGIYAVLIQQIGTADDISGAIWGCMGYTVLLCFCLFKTGSISKAVFTAH